MSPSPSPKSAAPSPASDGNALTIRGLTVAFHTEQGSLRAVDGVDLYLPKGKTLGVVG